MIKIIILTLLSASVHAAYEPFNVGKPVSSAQMNNNFNQVKNILSSRNTSISFSSFEPGDLITKEALETEADKVRALGLPISQLESKKIESQELNEFFNQMISLSTTYDDKPVAQSSTFDSWEDLVGTGQLLFTNNYGPSIASITQNASNGTVNLQANGAYTYTPNPNYFGADSFKYRISDTNSLSEEATITLNVQERFGLQKLANYRTYKDSKAAATCEDYYNNPKPQYEYDDEIGDGVYQVDTDGDGPLPPSVQYCNMTQRGSLINLAQVTIRSVTFVGSGNGYYGLVSVNGNTVGTNGGRGWTIAVFNKNLEYQYNTRYDTYASATNATNMRNALNALPNGTIVAFFTNDEPRANVYNNSTLISAIASFGCGSVSSVGERYTYICIGMKSASGGRLLGGPQIGNASPNYREQTYNINWLSSIFPY